MLRSKLTAFALTAILCLLCASAALADETIGELWNSGCELLFNTTNVTVDGEARFSLDGSEFKTAYLHYVQDGYCSFYGWKLLTPWPDGSERESGWTIIADDEGYYFIMEAFYPGTYRVGSDNCQNTLLRRSVELDALTDLGGIIAGELKLPEGTMTVNEQDTGKTVRIALKNEQLPNLAASALNLAAGFLSDRWFSYGYDRSNHPDDGVYFENYVTVTEALTDGTAKWLLNDMDIEFTLDGQGRLTGVSGKIGAQSVFWDGAIRSVDVQLNLAITDYGTSEVKPFDPAEYNVVRVSDYDISPED